MEAWNKVTENRFLSIYLISSIILAVLVIVNTLTGSHKIRDALVLFLGAILFSWRTISAPAWKNIEHKKRAWYRLMGTFIFAFLILEIEKLAGAWTYFSSFLGMRYSLIVSFVESFFLFFGFYYLVSGKFMSKVLVNGGPFQKDKEDLPK